MQLKQLPGNTKTPLRKDIDAGTTDWLVTKHPIGKLDEPEEVAEPVLWLSGPQSSFVTDFYF